MSFSIGDRVIGQLIGLQEWKGVIEGIAINYIPLGTSDGTPYLGSFYTVRVDSSTFISGLRADQLTLLAEVPAQDYLDLFI